MKKTEHLLIAAFLIAVSILAYAKLVAETSTRQYVLMGSSIVAGMAVIFFSVRLYMLAQRLNRRPVLAPIQRQ